MMRNWLSLSLVLVVFVLFSFGCAGIAKDAKIKCPKCGAIFTVDEGLAEIQRKGY